MIDLDKLEQLAQAVGPEEWFSDQTGSIWLDPDDTRSAVAEVYLRTDGKDDARQAFIAAANPAVVLELVRQVRVLTAQAEALHKVGTAMGLLAGADLTKETVPAILDLFERCRLAEDVAAGVLQSIHSQPNTVLVMNGVDAEKMYGIRDNLVRIMPPGTMCALLPDGMTLEQMDEDGMREHGWVKADQVDEDAARWRAFLGSQRIRPLGSAGLEHPEPNNYAHMGLEIWTTYGRNYSPELVAKLDSDNERARRWLIKYADVARAAQGMSIAEEDAAVAARVDQVIAEHGGNHG